MRMKSSFDGGLRLGRPRCQLFPLCPYAGIRFIRSADLGDVMVISIIEGEENQVQKKAERVF